MQPAADLLMRRNLHLVAQIASLPSSSEAVALYGAALDSAMSAGVELALDPIELTPSVALGKAIDFSLTKAESAGE